MSVQNHTQVHTHIAGYMYQGKFLLWPYNCNVRFPKWFFLILIYIYVYIQFNIYLKFWLCFPILQLLLDPSHLHTYSTWCFFLLFQKNPQKTHKRNNQKINTKDAKQNETKIHKNIIEPVLCCLTTPDHGSCPRMCLIHPVDPIWSTQWHHIGERWFPLSPQISIANDF